MAATNSLESFLNGKNYFTILRYFLIRKVHLTHHIPESQLKYYCQGGIYINIANESKCFDKNYMNSEKVNNENYYRISARKIEGFSGIWYNYFMVYTLNI